MSDPLSALLIFILLSISLLLLFIPGKGFYWQYKKGKRNIQRVLLEDTLKQLYDHEYRNKHATLKSINGALDITLDETAHILEKLVEQKLARFVDGHFTLTAAGRTDALRIIRIHRLWERFYADETGFSEMDWHKQAELKEHTTSAGEAEKLAQKMGHPSFDPHGDPIPTASGALPPQKGVALSKIESGKFVRITHIEDEPEALYAQLVAEGLYPGMVLHLQESGNEKLLFIAEGKEIILAPIVAANITVIELILEEEEPTLHQSLDMLLPGQSARVIDISKACRGSQRRRLMDLGIIPGTHITAELESASKNPIAYNIRGALIALRYDQANLIRIEQLSS